mmetsp:Transcript_4924/g.18537  ORF Transcript_4924/g.18537 Transcript_4924/m.18537 type:complete len:219 (-) Transcript_4924:122-778(-)
MQKLRIATTHKASNDLKHSYSSPTSIYCPPMETVLEEKRRNASCNCAESEVSSVSISDIDLMEYKPTALSDELLRRRSMLSARSGASEDNLNGRPLSRCASSSSSLSASPRMPSRYFQDEVVKQIVEDMKGCIFSSHRAKILEERVLSSQLILKSDHVKSLITESGYISSYERKEVLLSLKCMIKERNWQENVIAECFEAKWDREEMMKKCGENRGEN